MAHFPQGSKVHLRRTARGGGVFAGRHRHKPAVPVSSGAAHEAGRLKKRRANRYTFGGLSINGYLLLSF